MKKQTARRLLAITRLFVAVTTLMLLTATVWHQPDHDGYQGTHLFFMPRSNWEMDEGRGMLYDEEHYRGMDLLRNYGEGAFEREYEEEEGYYESIRPMRKVMKVNMARFLSTTSYLAPLSAECLIPQECRRTNCLPIAI
jgi:hypothetical protein